MSTLSAVDKNFTLFNVSFDKRDLPNIVEKVKPVVVALAAIAIFATALTLYAAALPTFIFWEPIGFWLAENIGALSLLSGGAALGAHYGIKALYNRVITPWAKEQAESVTAYHNRSSGSFLSSALGVVVGHCFVIGVETLLVKQGPAFLKAIRSLWANMPSVQCRVS